MAIAVKVWARGGGVDPPLGQYPEYGGTLQANTERGSINWPQRCTCCGDYTNNWKKLDVSKGKQTGNLSRGWSTSFQIPCCQNCVKHWAVYSRFNSVFGFVVGLPLLFAGYLAGCLSYPSIATKIGYGLAIFVAFFVGFVTFILPAIALGLLSKKFAARAYKGLLKPSCSSTADPVKCIDMAPPPQNSYTFNFQNQEYAKLFKDANH